MMIPNTEFTGLVNAVMEAAQAAGQDRPEDGYKALLAGLWRAEKETSRSTSSPHR